MSDEKEYSKIVMWAVLENVATMACALFGAWLVSPWMLLILLNMNTVRSKKL